MSESCDKLMQGAYTNNSFGIQAVNDSLTREYQNSFGYLSRFQKNIIRFDHYTMHTYRNKDTDEPFLREFYMDRLYRVSTDICHDILDISKKEDYFNSQYYEQEITIEDIMANTKLFTRIPILLIDGIIYHDLIFRYIDGRTEIHIKGLDRTFLVEEGDPTILDYYERYMKYSEHDVQLIVFDNIYSMTLNYNYIHATINSQNIQKISTGRPSGSVFLAYYTYLSNGKRVSSHPYIVRQEGGQVSISLYAEDAKQITATSDPILYLYQWNNCYKWVWNNTVDITAPTYETFDSDGGTILRTTVFVLKDENSNTLPHPVPVTNIALMRKPSGKSYYELVPGNETTLKLHYPNMYEIIDPYKHIGDQYRVFYFYYDTQKELDTTVDPLLRLNDLSSYECEYRHMYEFYYQYLIKKTGARSIENAIDMVIRNQITANMFHGDNPTAQRTAFINRFYKLFNYEQPMIEIGLIDYVTNYYPSMYTPVRVATKLKEPFEYKVEQMWKFVRMDDEVLHRYVIRQNIVGESYYLYENTTNLDDRTFVNTGTDLGDTCITFDEPVCRFIFEHFSEQRVPINIRVFVDGIYMHDMTHLSNGPHDFVYVPRSAFTKDCMMELEVFPDFEYKESFELSKTLEQSEEFTMEFPKDVQPTLADLYVTMDEADQKVFADDFWRAHMIMGDMEIDAFDEKNQPLQEFTPLKNFKISTYVPELFDYGNKFYMNFSKKSNLFHYTVEEPCTPNIVVPWGYLKPEKEYIRVFKNGRLVNPSLFFLMYKARPLTVQLFLQCVPGDKITVDVTPYKYKEIYYQRKIDFNKPLIDLSGHITKNFDNRYYDVYVNGRKMSWNSCFAISPSLIALVNLKSSNHLEVFEIDRDDEYFGLDYTTTDHPFNIGDMIDDGYMDEDEIKDLIIGTIDDQKDDDLIIHPNTDEEDPEPEPDEHALGEFWVYYYGELVPTMLVDPNIYQVYTKKVSKLYPLIAETYYVEEDAMMLDPNILIEGKTDEITQAFMYGANEFLLDE